MDIVIAAVVVAVGLLAGPGAASPPLSPRPASTGAAAQPTAGAPKGPVAGGAEPVETDLKERRAEVVRLEEQVLTKEEALDSRLAGLADREKRLHAREEDIE